jgi:3-dehydroquinate synthase
LSSHETVRVELGPRSYDIVVGDDVLATAGKIMAPVLRHPRVIVVTDDNVAPLHLHALPRLSCCRPGSRPRILPISRS